MRPLGDIMLDIEPLIMEMTEEHDMQWYEVLSIIHGYLQVHAPDSQEVYEDGSKPVFYYGPKK